MTRNDAILLLDPRGVYILSKDDLTATRIRAAFARAVRDAHPDTANDSQDAAERIASLQEARDLLLSEHDSTLYHNRACKVCSGSGKVRARLGVTACSACGGTGERRQ